MPQIETIISAQNFELIRDRIGEILIDEIQGQIDLGNNIELKTLFTERHIPLDKIHLPAIAVSVGQGDFSNKSPRSVDGEYSFYIDVFAKSKSIGDDDGDSLASKKVHKLVGVIRTILESPLYENLGFQAPFIARSIVSNIGFGTVQEKDESNIQMARMTFKLTTQEGVKLKSYDLIYDYWTQVKLGDTSKGYLFNGPDGSFPPDPDTCLPSTLNVNSALFTTIPSGDTYNLNVKDQDGNPVGVKVGTDLVVNITPGTSTEEALFEYLNIFE